MSITTPNPTRTNHRARRVGQAVISAYIHELAAPARPASSGEAAPVVATPVGDSQTVGSRRRGDCQGRTFSRQRHAPAVLAPATA
jgi:hypothetical protein